MIKLKNDYNCYTTLGENYFQHEKKISGLCIDTKIKEYYINGTKTSNKLKKNKYHFKVLQDKFIISDKINKTLFNNIKNCYLKFGGPNVSGDLPVINGKTCINSLLEFQNIYGTNFTKNDSTYNNLFKAEIPSPTETYYWDDSRYSREGIRIINKQRLNITGIYVYGSYSYPLYECYLEQMDESGSGSYVERLFYQYGVGNEGNSSYKPMYYNFDKDYNSTYTDFVRYSVYDSAITRILIFGEGYNRKILLEKNGHYYSIKDELYNTDTKEYNSLGTSLNNELFEQNSFNISELLQEKAIQDEIFKPLDKFNDFKIVILTEEQEELDKIQEIELNVIGEDIVYPIMKKEEPKKPTNKNKILENIDFIIQSDSIRCTVVENRRKKFVLQPNIETKIVIKSVGKKEDEEEGKLKGETNLFTLSN